MQPVLYEEMFPWQIAAAMAAAPLGYVPLGTLEWHGEHAAVGLDAIKAQELCVAAARRSGGLVLPALHWSTDSREDLPDGSYLTGGVEQGERYHVPGSMFWLRPETFRLLLLDVWEAMQRRGFRAIVVVSGHWNPEHNIAAIHAAGTEFQRAHPDIGWLLVTDQELVPDLHYPLEHAAGGETSLMLAIRCELVDLSAIGETDGRLAQHYADQPDHLQRWRSTPHPWIGVNPGVEDGSNDPEDATIERGRELFETIAARLAERAASLLDVTQAAGDRRLDG